MSCKIAIKATIVAVALSAVTSVAWAEEPRKLTDAQMDQVTAGSTAEDALQAVKTIKELYFTIAASDGTPKGIAIELQKLAAKTAIEVMDKKFGTNFKDKIENTENAQELIKAIGNPDEFKSLVRKISNKMLLAPAGDYAAAKEIAEIVDETNEAMEFGISVLKKPNDIKSGTVHIPGEPELKPLPSNTVISQNRRLSGYYGSKPD